MYVTVTKTKQTKQNEWIERMKNKMTLFALENGGETKREKMTTTAIKSAAKHKHTHKQTFENWFDFSWFWIEMFLHINEHWNRVGYFNSN